MKEITLPIKCSTVKKANSMLEYVLFAELTVLSGLGTFAFLYLIYMVEFHTDFVYANVNEFILYYFSAIIPLMWIIVVNPFKYLPAITCIKDEETK
ncbi:MAG: hypothetical protein M0Q91_15175 [Methanoregula sp.]|jgi:hypothetical protein|nr:hypothetical protein [Methanoregula sp.]